MLGHQSLLNISVLFSLLFLHACISKTLKIGREKRYTEEDICLESKETVEEVKECPNDITTIMERSIKKNCRRYPKCAGESLAYHCVRSGESLVEVCAPITNITGRCCAYYDKSFGRVIEDYNNRCSLCPFKYLSDKSFEYIECVKTNNDETSEHPTPANANLTVTDYMQKPCDAENSAECEGDYKQNWTNNITRTTLTNETSEHNSPKQRKDDSNYIIGIVIATTCSCLAIACICTYLYQNRLRKACTEYGDWLKNIMGFSKPQTNETLHCECREAMIKDECRQ